VQGSEIASRGMQGARRTVRPLEPAGKGAVSDRSGAVLALVVSDLARIWSKQTRKRGSTLTTAINATPPTSEDSARRP
jgi:hypothetical protein